VACDRLIDTKNPPFGGFLVVRVNTLVRFGRGVAEPLILLYLMKKKLKVGKSKKEL
jgi:hypothetical protein